MGILDSAVLLLQAKHYSGSGEWLDESGNGHHAQFGSTAGSDTNDPQINSWDGQNYIYFNGVAGNNVEVTLANNTVYDYTVTYKDDSTDTGTETSDGSGVVTFGDTDVKFDSLKVKLIDVYPDGGGATLALFDASLATEPFASFTDSESKLWTINRSGPGLYLVDRASFGFYTDDYFKIADHDDLDFTTGEDFTVMTVHRKSPSGTDYYNLIAKKEYYTNNAGYVMSVAIAAGSMEMKVANGTVWRGTNGYSGVTDLVTHVLAGVRDADTDLTGYLDGVPNAPTTDLDADDLRTANDLYIGGNWAYWLSGEIMAVVLWRSALTDAEIVEAGDALESTVSEYDETGLSTAIVSTLSGTDVLSAVESNTVSIVSAIQGTDIALFVDSTTITTITTVSGSDAATSIEILAIDILATVTGTDALIGVIAYDETGGIIAVISTTVGVDVMSAVDSLTVTITSTINGSDVWWNSSVPSDPGRGDTEDAGIRGSTLHTTNLGRT